LDFVQCFNCIVAHPIGLGEVGGFTRSETEVFAFFRPGNWDSTTISTDLGVGCSFCPEEGGVLSLFIGNEDDLG